MTQAELAKKTNLSVPYISHVERATKRVSILALSRIADALEVPLNQLIVSSQDIERNMRIPEAEALLADCSYRERHILLDIAEAAKQSLRRNL